MVSAAARKVSFGLFRNAFFILRHNEPGYLYRYLGYKVTGKLLFPHKIENEHIRYIILKSSQQTSSSPTTRMPLQEHCVAATSSRGNRMHQSTTADGASPARPTFPLRPRRIGEEGRWISSDASDIMTLVEAARMTHHIPVKSTLLLFPHVALRGCSSQLPQRTCTSTLDIIEDVLQLLDDDDDDDIFTPTSPRRTARRGALSSTMPSRSKRSRSNQHPARD